MHLHVPLYTYKVYTCMPITYREDQFAQKEYHKQQSRFSCNWFAASELVFFYNSFIFENLI